MNGRARAMTIIVLLVFISTLFAADPDKALVDSLHRKALGFFEQGNLGESAGCFLEEAGLRLGLADPWDGGRRSTAWQARQPRPQQRMP